MKRALRIGMLTPVVSVDPRQALDASAAMVADMIFESPFAARDEEGFRAPVLFDARLRGESSLMGRGVYLAQVREGLFFSDGSPLSAASVAAWYGQHERFSSQVDVNAVGEGVIFRSKSSGVDLSAWLSLRTAAVAKQEAHKLLGTGPYKLQWPYSPGEVTLVRNEHSATKPFLDELVFHAFPPDAHGRPVELLAALKAGDIDFSTCLSRQDAAQLQGFNRRYEPGGSVALLFLNTQRAPFDKVDARLEVCEAIDGAALANDTYDQPMAFVPRGLMPPALFSGVRVPGPSAPTRRGALRGKSLRLVTMWAPRPYLPYPERSSRLVAHQLERCGCKTEVVVPESASDCLEIVRRGDYDMMVGGWIADGPDPVDFVWSLFASDAIPIPGGEAANSSNISRFALPEMDAALQNFRDAGDKQVSLRRLLTLAALHCPLIPLMFGANLTVYPRSVLNLPTRSNGSPDFARLHFVD